MLQDILFALLGFTGDIIVSVEDEAADLHLTSPYNNLSNEFQSSTEHTYSNNHNNPNPNQRVPSTTNTLNNTDARRNAKKTPYFHVKDGYDLLRDAEREMINKIVPLGWFYLKLQDFCARLDIGWGGAMLYGHAEQAATAAATTAAGRSEISGFGSRSSHILDTGARPGNSFKREVYKAAVARGLEDLLNEYVADVTYFEQLSLHHHNRIEQQQQQQHQYQLDGLEQRQRFQEEVEEVFEAQLPLSQVLQHFQKYLLVFPQIWDILTEMEGKGFRGCQLLDFFTQKSISSGVPVVTVVLNRLIVRLRAVFLKQTFSWMVFGTLEDPALEYFIQPKQAQNSHESTGVSLNFPGKGVGSNVNNNNNNNNNNNMYARVIERLYNSQNNNSNNGRVGGGVIGRGSGVRVAGFDWATSYVLKLELIPDTHTSARTVAQILFAGKGVKLVQQTVQGSGMDSGNWTNNNTNNNNSFDTVDVYRYLSAGYNQSSALPPFLSAEAKEKPIEQQQQQSASSFSSSSRTNHAGITPNNDIFGQKNTSFRTHLPGDEGPSNGENPSASFSKSSSFVQFSGFELHEIEDFTRSFGQILHVYEHSHANAEGNGHIHDIGEAVDLLEKAVEQIHDIMAHRLWKLLKEKLNFGSFVQVIRNTFLVGKGELVQNILEGVHELTKQPVNYPSIATRNTAFWANTPGSSSLFSPSQTRSSIFAEGESKNVMENLLNRQVLANAGKLVGLEPEHLQDFLTLGLNNQNLSIRDFSGHQQQQQQGEEDEEVFFSGAAVCQPSHSEIENEKFANDSQNPHTTYSTTNNNHKLRNENLSKNPQFSSQRMLPISTVVSLCTQIGTSASQDFQEIWAAYLCQQTTFGVSSAQQYGYTRAAAAAAAAKLNAQRFATISPKDNSKGGDDGETAAAGENLQNFEGFKNDENLQFSTGGVWLSDAKHVVKGFAFSSEFFVVNWGKIRELLAVMAMRLALHHISTANYADPSDEIDGIGSFEYELALGSFSCVLHGDRKQLSGFLSGGGKSLSNYAQQYNGVSFVCTQKQRQQQQGGFAIADEYSTFETSTNNNSSSNHNAINNNNNNNNHREHTAGGGAERGRKQGRERGGGVGVVGLPPLPAGALSVGVSFHALITHKESDKLDNHGPKTRGIPEIRYFARMFVRESSSSRSAAQLRSSSYLNNPVVGQDPSERDGMLAEALIDLDNNFYEPSLAHTENEQQRENEGEKEVVTSEETILRELTTHSLAPSPSSSFGVRQDKQDSSDRGAEETEKEKEPENKWQSENVMKRLAAVRAQISRSIESGGISCLEIEYARELVPSSSFSSHKNSNNWSAESNFLSPPPSSNSSSALSMGKTCVFSDFRSRTSAVPGHSTNAVVYKLRARLNAHEMFSRKQKQKQGQRHTQGKEERGISSGNGEKSSGKRPEKDWDIEVGLDVNTYVRCVAGQAYIGAVGSGLCIPISSSPFGGGEDVHDSSKSLSNTHAENFNVHVFSISFRGRSALSSYPVASPFTATRYPDTFLRLEREMAQLRAWMHLKLRIRFPDSRFQTIFDPEAMRQYERIFAFIMKVRLVAHALEKLWIARSRLISDRIFCLMRHSMHFFLSNLLYYLQVDVVDSEFCEFQRAIDESADFPSVLRAHRNFLANVLRVSLIDNLSVQEGLERVLQVCLRFVAVCRILHQAESHQASANLDPTSILHTSHTERGERGEIISGGRMKQQQYPQEQQQQQQQHNVRERERERGEKIKGGYADPLLAYPALIFVPPEEFAAIHKDFYNQVAFLFQIMRKVESRGFLFRLDFNGFLSRMAASNGATAPAAGGMPYGASSY